MIQMISTRPCATFAATKREIPTDICSMTQKGTCNMGKIAKRVDAFINALTGFGDSTRDSLMSATTTSGRRRLPDSTLEDLYHSDDMAARICDALPKEGLAQRLHPLPCRVG